MEFYWEILLILFYCFYSEIFLNHLFYSRVLLYFSSLVFRLYNIIALIQIEFMINKLILKLEKVYFIQQLNI